MERHREDEVISLTQIPQDTFNELPADIQHEIMHNLRETRGPKRKRVPPPKDAGAGAASPSRARRPAPVRMLTRLDIDMEVLRELPPEVRAEVERQYGIT